MPVDFNFLVDTKRWDRFRGDALLLRKYSRKSFMLLRFSASHNRKAKQSFKVIKTSHLET